MKKKRFSVEQIAAAPSSGPTRAAIPPGISRRAQRRLQLREAPPA